eukprot:2878323-Amphidinium_carterae.2
MQLARACKDADLRGSVVAEAPESLTLVTHSRHDCAALDFAQLSELRLVLLLDSGSELARPY